MRIILNNVVLLIIILNYWSETPVALPVGNENIVLIALYPAKAFQCLYFVAQSSHNRQFIE